jgi:hypothetical protein
VADVAAVQVARLDALLGDQPTPDLLLVRRRLPLEVEHVLFDTQVLGAARSTESWQ